MKHCGPACLAAVAGLSLLGGCATNAPSYNYAAFQRARPATLLVMPPVNESPDIKASPSVWAQATRPLAEAGYYVLPVTLVDETLRQNGVGSADDAQKIPYPKLRDVFGADAAVYIRVVKYGTTYAVLTSGTRVAVVARIVDLRTGELLWAGYADVDAPAPVVQQKGGILAALMTSALVAQVANTITDKAFNIAGAADAQLLGARHVNGILPGPRSPLYGRPPAAR